MPFQSEKQRRYLWANEPKIARDWADTYGSRIKKDDGGIMRVNYIHGGITHPDGRRGFPGGSGKEPGVGSGSSGQDSSHDRGGRQHRAAATHAQAQASHDRGGQQQRAAAAHAQAQASHDRGGQQHKQKANLKILPGTGEKDIKDVVDTRKRIDDRKPTWGEKFKQNSLNRNKLLSLKNLGFIKGWNPFAKLPAWAEDMTEDEFAQWMSATKLNPNEMPRTKADVAKFTKGEDLMGRVFEGEGLLNRGNLNASEWERLFPTKNMNQAGGGGGDGQGGGYTGPTLPYIPGEDLEKPEDPISDFQKSLIPGANNSFDYYVGKDPSAKNLAWGKQMGVDPRTMGLTSFAAEGGRIPAAFGGIMDSSTGRRAYGLGSIFKSIKKAASKVLGSKVGKLALGAGAMYGAHHMGWLGKNKFLGKMFTGGKGALDSGWNPWKIGIGALSAAPLFMGGQDEDEDEGFDYMGAKNAYADEIKRIKAGAMAGSLDPNEFSYLGVKDGGRIGLYAGGQSTPSDYTMEDAMMTTTQDKLGGITDVMKQADLNRQGSVGQFYAAHGGSADAKLMARIKELQDEGLDYNSARAQAEKEAQGKAQGGRIGADEGGLMDLGGMEKDYRNDGGFVPLGGEEKADDVPARLSKNEFVFTADAVRGAGDGDIDKGAEIMENIMKNLEQGGQISEETQGLSGAQEMFGVSERLSEVV